MALYEDRSHAGNTLASALGKYAGRNDVIVLALPRGGVPVAFEIARHLGAPLDVFVVRKLGVPGQEELALGAVASGDVQVLDPEMVSVLRIPDRQIAAMVTAAKKELERRERAYRGDRPPLDVADRIAILVDDGLATGSTMRAAIKGLRLRWPQKIVVAVPIATPSTCAEIAAEVDDMVCAATAEPFFAVGVWYDDFSQTSDEEVRHLLELAAGEQAQRDASPTSHQERSPAAPLSGGRP